MTDVNSIEFQSASSRICDENNSSFILNQSNVPMDIDDDEILTPVSTKINGHISPPHTIENGDDDDEQDKEDVFLQGKPVLNKSFDVLPQIKDDDTPSADPISDAGTENSHVLDTTVELPNKSDESDDKPSQDLNIIKPVNNIDTLASTQTLLPNQFSVEYPFVIPQPEENTQPSSPTSVETVTTLTKNMKLNVNKTLEGQEPSTSTSITDKAFDTNTFVLKKKERRKVVTPANENSFDAAIEDTPPDLCNKQSPFNTPSVSLDTAVVPRPVTATSASQQLLMDPTRIM